MKILNLCCIEAKHKVNGGECACAKLELFTARLGHSERSSAHAEADTLRAEVPSIASPAVDVTIRTVVEVGGV